MSRRAPHVRMEQRLGEQAAILNSSTMFSMQLEQHLQLSGPLPADTILDGCCGVQQGQDLDQQEAIPLSCSRPVLGVPHVRQQRLTSLQV